MVCMCVSGGETGCEFFSRRIFVVSHGGRVCAVRVMYEFFPPKIDTCSVVVAKATAVIACLVQTHQQKWAGESVCGCVESHHRICSKI